MPVNRQRRGTNLWPALLVAYGWCLISNLATQIVDQDRLALRPVACPEFGLVAHQQGEPQLGNIGVDFGTQREDSVFESAQYGRNVRSPVARDLELRVSRQAYMSNHGDRPADFLVGVPTRAYAYFNDGLIMSRRGRCVKNPWVRQPHSCGSR